MIPDSILNLTNLIDLKLGINKLTMIPKNIGVLTNLTSLNIRERNSFYDTITY